MRWGPADRGFFAALRMTVQGRSPAANGYEMGAGRPRILRCAQNDSTREELAANWHEMGAGRPRILRCAQNDSTREGSSGERIRDGGRQTADSSLRSE